MASGGNLKFTDNADLAVVLDRLAELSAAGKEIGDLEKERDRLLTKGENCQCGRWLITWKETANGQWRKKIVALPGL